jgi:hypothetical protein
MTPTPSCPRTTTVTAASSCCHTWSSLRRRRPAGAWSSGSTRTRRAAGAPPPAHPEVSPACDRGQWTCGTSHSKVSDCCRTITPPAVVPSLPRLRSPLPPTCLIQRATCPGAPPAPAMSDFPGFLTPDWFCPRNAGLLRDALRARVQALMAQQAGLRAPPGAVARLKALAAEHAAREHRRGSGEELGFPNARVAFAFQGAAGKEVSPGQLLQGCSFSIGSQPPWLSTHPLTPAQVRRALPGAPRVAAAAARH